MRTDSTAARTSRICVLRLRVVPLALALGACGGEPAWTGSVTEYEGGDAVRAVVCRESGCVCLDGMSRKSVPPAPSREKALAACGMRDER